LKGEHGKYSAYTLIAVYVDLTVVVIVAVVKLVFLFMQIFPKTERYGSLTNNLFEQDLIAAALNLNWMRDSILMSRKYLLDKFLLLPWTKRVLQRVRVDGPIRSAKIILGTNDRVFGPSFSSLIEFTVFVINADTLRLNVAKSRALRANTKIAHPVSNERTISRVT
jgi:hypothetical protein